MLNARTTSRFRATPAWALIGLVGGTVGALVLVPDGSFHVAGELRLSALVLALGLMIGPIAATVRNLPAGLRTEHVLGAGLVYWILLDLIQGSFDLREVPRWAVQGAMLSVGLFACGLWVGSVLTDLAAAPVRIEQRRATNPSARFLFAGAVILFFVGTIRWAAPCQYDVSCLVDLFFYPRGASWLVAYVLGRQFDEWASLIHALRFCGYLVLPFAVALHHVERRVTWRVVVAALLGLVFLLLLVQEGGRRGVGTVVLVSALLWILLQQRIRLRHFVTLAGFALALLMLLQAMIVWRNVGIGSGLVDEKPIELKDRQGLVAVDRNFFYLTQIVAIIPDRHPHTGWRGVASLAALPIPRVLWPGKPEDRGINLPVVLGLGSRRSGFVTNSAVGDFYIIGGNVAVVLGGLLFGVLARCCSRLLEGTVTVPRRLIYALVTMTLFVSLRALAEVVITGYAVLAAVGIVAARRIYVAMATPARSARPPGVTQV